MCLVTRYKKSARTCRAHRKSGIAKHREENEPRNKYPTLSYIPRGVQHGPYTVYTNRMSASLSSPLFVEIGDFDFRVKARNAFLTRGFLPSGSAKVVNASENTKFISRNSPLGSNLPGFSPIDSSATGGAKRRYFGNMTSDKRRGFGSQPISTVRSQWLIATSAGFLVATKTGSAR